MSWLFSQALVEEYLVDTCLDGEPSAPLSGNPTPQAYCAPDKMTKFSRLSRFGMTYKPLTDDLGQELLTLYLEAFHARTFQPQEKAQELKETNPQCGNTWQGSLARLDPNTSLWKTAQCSLLEDLELSLQTFPRWGSMQNGALYPLPTLVQTISVKEFGSEPNNETFFHTPNTMGLDGGSNSRKALKKRLQLPTPDASARGPTKNYDPKAKSQSGRTLQSFVAKWPTPTANMHKGSGPTLIRNDGKDRSWDSLHYAVEQVTDIGGTLNPTWVEWVMGWPLGWTDLKPLEMDKCLYVQQLHGSYLNE
jgi:DNA (cytosine-5)-methyltransferase 1